MHKARTIELEKAGEGQMLLDDIPISDFIAVSSLMSHLILLIQIII